MEMVILVDLESPVLIFNLKILDISSILCYSEAGFICTSDATINSMKLIDWWSYSDLIQSSWNE